MDVVAPRDAVLHEPFDLGVAVRQPESPPLTVADLEQTASEEGHIFRTELEEVVAYRVEVQALGCSVTPDHYVLRLRHGMDSPVYYFQITPTRPGRSVDSDQCLSNAGFHARRSDQDHYRGRGAGRSEYVKYSLVEFWRPVEKPGWLYVPLTFGRNVPGTGDYKSANRIFCRPCRGR